MGAIQRSVLPQGTVGFRVLPRSLSVLSTPLTLSVPGDLSQTSEDQSLSDFEISNRALINVWIPSVFLRGKAANAFHVYQVYIRIKDDEWNVYRRYTEFRSLHHKLQNKYPQVRAYNFPPKKAIGNKDAKFVEERRKQLQNYLRSVMNKVIQVVPEFAASPKKETLTQLMPFFVIALEHIIESSTEAGEPSRAPAHLSPLEWEQLQRGSSTQRCGHTTAKEGEPAAA
ncbi:Sorting nexin-29 [Tupaia chinensis]|uniref:Sorting nexin-29 n=1 Tax=Tupaia chinensis TaxID=246437 RepID=L9KXX5_TUPCH|nr:Sorting nexin-29 [Tupaia chinensis]